MADYTLRLLIDGDSAGATSALNSATSALNSFGSKSMMAGGILTAGITLPLVALGKGALDASTKLNAAMANIGSMGVAIPRVNELKKAIQDLSMATGKSTDDLAKGTYQIISAFGDNADTIKSLEVNTKIAAAGVATLTDTVNMVSIVTKNWGDSSIEAQQHVGDLALTTVALGQTTLPALAQSLGGVAPMAHAAGLSQEELYAIMATGSGVIGSTSEVVTKLARTISVLEKPNKELGAIIKANGFASGDAMIKSLGFEGAIMKIKAAADKAGISVIQLTKSKESASLITAFTTTLSATYAKNLEAEGKVAGETGMAYDAQANGVNKAGHAMEIMSATMTVVMQKIGDGMGPALLNFAGLIQPVAIGLMDLVDKFTALDPATQTWIVGLAAGAAAIGPVLLAVGSFSRAIAFFIPLASGMATTLLGLAIPLGLLYGAYRLNVLGLGDLVNNGLQRVQAAAPLAEAALKSVWLNLTGSRDQIGTTTAAVYNFVQALTGSSDAGLAAVNWVVGLGTKIQDAKDKFTLAGGGINGFVAALGKLTGADVTVNVKSKVTSVDWTGSIGALSYTYDAKAGITTVDWTGKNGDLNFVYDSKAGITSVDWKNLLGTGSDASFVYDAVAGIKEVHWNEDLFKYNYSATAGITIVDFGYGLFVGTYTATAGITKVAWGAYTYSYNVAGSVTSVAWGAYTKTYTATSTITSVAWGAWTNTYDATGSITSVLWGAWSHNFLAGATVEEKSVLWGAFTHTYDAKSQIGSTGVLWGLWTNTYDAGANVGQASVLWGAWTFNYSATAGITDVTWGAWTHVYDAAVRIKEFITGAGPSSVAQQSAANMIKTGDLWNPNGHAAGTDYAPGGWSWVGEKGPELMRVPAGAQILSNDNSRKLIGHLADGNIIPFAPGAFMGPYAPGKGPDNQILGPFNPSNVQQMALSLVDISKHASVINKNTDGTHKTLLTTAVRMQQEEARRIAFNLAHFGNAPAQVAGSAGQGLGVSFKEMQQAGMDIAKAFKGTTAEFESFIKSVPGLFATSQVTAGDMEAAKAGTYTEKADEKLRQLRDLAEHGVSYPGMNPQEFKDALNRIGVVASNDLKILAQQATTAWNDNTLFSDKKNLALITMTAAKAQMVQKQKADMGAANIMEMFGITDAAVQAGGVATGKKARTALQSGLTGALTGVDATGKATAGSDSLIASLAGDMGKQVIDSTAFGDVGAAILQKITSTWSDASKLPDMIGPIGGALKVQIGGKDGAQVLFDSGAAIFKTIMLGYQDAATKGDFIGPIAAAIAKSTAPSTTGTGTPVVVKAQASGTNFWSGGLVQINERGGEIVDLPRGSRIYPHDVSQKMAAQGGGGDTHIWNVTANGPIDYEDLAYRVNKINNRRRG